MASTSLESVGVAIVGADDDVIFAGVAQHVVEVVIGFRGDVDIEFFERQFGKAFAAGAPGCFFDHPRNPLGRRFDECSTQFGKLFR